jgi:hypothetical protein
MNLEAQTVVREWLAQQPVLFVAEDIQKRVSRWDKSLNAAEDLLRNEA